MSQKETHIFYDRREWAAASIIFFFAFFFALSIFLGYVLGEREPFGRLGRAFFFVLFLMLCSLAFADSGNLRITVTVSGIRLKQGFFFSHRTISYDEIVDIVFENSTEITLHERPPSQEERYFSVLPFRTEGSEFIINLHDGDVCIVGSAHTKKILDAIKKAQPHIEIN